MKNKDNAPSSPEGFEQKPLPIWLRVPGRLAKSFTFLSPKLQPEQLARAASRKAGLEPNFSPHVGAGLEAICRSLQDEANLHWFGKMNYSNLMVTGLSELLLLNETFKNQPELDQQKLNTPVFVTGMPRSGTTFLHRLLSAPKQTTSIPLYRLMFPNNRRLPTAKLETELIFFSWKYASKRYGMDAIHYVRPGLADECNFGMRLSMYSMIYWSMSPTYSYLSWFLEQDMRESYQIYRRVLQLHQARNPGKRIILKCPHHLAFLPALSEVFPEAIIVQTHREPLEVIPSECKLILSLQAISTEKLDWEATVKSNLQKASIFASRSVDFAKSNTPTQAIHVDYRQLVNDPIKLAQEIYAQVGITLDQQELNELKTFYGANRQNKHGKNKYSLEQFGLTAEGVNQEFAAYREQFLDDLAPLV